MQSAKAEYSFWKGRKFILESGEKISLNGLKSRIEALFKDTSIFDEAAGQIAHLKFDPNSATLASEQVNQCWQACADHVETTALYRSPDNKEKWVSLVKQLDVQSDAAFYANQPSLLLRLCLKIRRFICNLFSLAHPSFRKPNFVETTESYRFTHDLLQVNRTLNQLHVDIFGTTARCSIDTNYAHLRETIYQPTRFELDADDVTMFHGFLDWLQAQLPGALGNSNSIASQVETGSHADSHDWPEDFGEMAIQWQKTCLDLSEESITALTTRLEFLKKEFREKTARGPIYAINEKGVCIEIEEASESKKAYRQHALNHLKKKSVDYAHSLLEIEKIKKTLKKPFPPYLEQPTQAQSASSQTVKGITIFHNTYTDEELDQLKKDPDFQRIFRASQTRPLSLYGIFGLTNLSDRDQLKLGRVLI